MSHKYFVGHDNEWKPVKEAYIGVGRGWRKQKIKLIGHNGKWVEVLDHLKEQPQGACAIESLSMRGGWPLQSGLSFRGQNIGNKVAPIPKAGGFFLAVDRLYDTFENFSSLKAYWDGSSEDNAPASEQDPFGKTLRLLPSKGQYLRLPDNPEDPFDLSGFMGNDGEAEDEPRGKKYWEFAVKFKPVSMPSGGERMYLMYAGTDDQHLGLYFDSVGTLTGEFKNFDYVKELKIPGAAVQETWTGVSFRHVPEGTMRTLYLEVVKEDGSSQQVSVQGDYNHLATDGVGTEFKYWKPQPLEFIYIGKDGDSASRTPVYADVRIKQLVVRNEPLESDTHRKMVLNPSLSTKVKFRSVETGQEYDVSGYISKQDVGLVSVDVPELPSGHYMVSIDMGDGLETGEFDFYVEEFKGRATPLVIDFTTATVDEVRTNLVASHKGWGGVNGGTHVENTKFIPGQSLDCYACGDNYTGNLIGTNGRGEPNGMKTRIGGCVVTRDYFGPGSYRLWVKPAEKTGVCNAVWTFQYQESYEGSPLYQKHLEDGLHPVSGGDGDKYAVRNHEIDIEFPTALKGDANMEVVSYQNARFNLWRGENLNWDVPNDHPDYWEEYNDNFVHHGVNLDDGQVHELRFDWHLGSDPRVEFYIDGVHYNTNREQVPTIPGRYWMGLWFPSANTHWAGRGANFDIETFSMKRLEIIPFVEEYDQAATIGETFPYDVFRDIPVMLKV